MTRDSRGYVAISLTYGHVRWQGLRSHFSFPPHFGDPEAVGVMLPLLIPSPLGTHETGGVI